MFWLVDNKQDWTIKKQVLSSGKKVKCAHRIKCVKVRALLIKHKVRFARAEQLCCIPTAVENLAAISVGNRTLHSVSDSCRGTPTEQ